jgi:hypothetical protein
MCWRGPHKRKMINMTLLLILISLLLLAGLMFAFIKILPLCGLKGG